MHGFYKNDIPPAALTGFKSTRKYIKEKIGLSDVTQYIQSGILMFNLIKLKEIGFSKSSLSMAENGGYWFPDQDIINKISQGQVHFLDFKWNVLHGNGDADSLRETLPIQSQKKYTKAREKPKIIHFAGERKPWEFIEVDFSSAFWINMRKSPFYESSLEKSLKNNILSSFPLLNLQQRKPISKALKEKIKKKFPMSSKRGKLARELYWFMTRIQSIIKSATKNKTG